MKIHIAENGWVISDSNLKLLSNADAARKFGISNERIRQIRSKFGLPSISETLETNKINNVLAYLSSAPVNIKIKELNKYCETRFFKLDIKRIAELNNIKISFFNDSEYEHGLHLYRGPKKCKCEICMLSNALYQHFWKDRITTTLVNYFANEYIKLYENLSSKNFYKIIKEKLNKKEYETKPPAQ